MYEELVKRLREESEIERWLQPHSANETPKLLDDAADAIEELTDRIDGEWIPVDEYGVLPDHYETVLLYVESEPEGYITIGSYDYIEMRWKDFCDVNREVYQADVVTHWMPLPEPPKEEE